MCVYVFHVKCSINNYNNTNYYNDGIIYYNNKVYNGNNNDYNNNNNNNNNNNVTLTFLVSYTYYVHIYKIFSSILYYVLY